MNLMDLLILLHLVLPGLAVSREFFHVNLPKNWTEAQSYCREKFLDLVTIEDAGDWSRMSNMFANSALLSESWIGLYDDVKSWRWSLDSTLFYEQDSASWLVLDEDNVGSIEHCAQVSNSELQDKDCELNYWFVCFDETSNSYIKVQITKNWPSAQAYCRETYTDLASVRNQQEMDAIMAEVGTGWAWIGLSRESWKWSDGSGSSFRQWNTGDPYGGNEACGGVVAAGLFDDACEKKHPFFCTAPPRKVLRVMLKSAGSVNLNDPLVQEAVLKQMETDLKGQGVHQEFRLSWRKQRNGDVFNKTGP